MHGSSVTGLGRARLLLASTVSRTEQLTPSGQNKLVRLRASGSWAVRRLQTGIRLVQVPSRPSLALLSRRLHFYSRCESATQDWHLVREPKKPACIGSCAPSASAGVPRAVGAWSAAPLCMANEEVCVHRATRGLRGTPECRCAWTTALDLAIDTARAAGLQTEWMCIPRFLRPLVSPPLWAPPHLYLKTLASPSRAHTARRTLSSLLFLNWSDFWGALLLYSCVATFVTGFGSWVHWA